MPRFVSPKNEIDLEYFELLKKIDARLVSGRAVDFIDWSRTCGRVFWIRHDVDHDLSVALQMARAEAEMGYTATYFLLHTAPYWFEPALFEAADKLLSLGHDIGLHNNAISAWLDSSILPLAVIDCALGRLSKYCVRMTSSHGDRKCRKWNFCNYEIWSECPEEYRKTELLFPRDSLDAYGLSEAYFQRRDAYLSDSGHKWRGQIGAAIPPFEQFDNYLGPEETIGAFNQMGNGVLQLLVHPFWWYNEEDT